MNRLLFAAALAFAAACASKSPPPASEPAPTEPTGNEGITPGAAMAPGDCTAKGGEVRGDIGDGKVACAAGEKDLGRVAQGIEGAVCCAPGTP